MVMMRTMMETGMNAVERIDFYTHNIPAEPDTVEPPVAVPAEWPATGRVEFRDYSMRYREGLPLVLRKTSFAVGVGEKVPPPPSRTDWTRLVPPPVLTGHVSSLPPY
jgi:ATP-binding cassette subfamily C (CFTR/MRP) protein 1